MTLIHNFRLALGGLLIAGLAACGGGGGGSSSGANNGSLRLALTDAPACGFDSVNLTIEKIRVHQSPSANDADNGWSEIVLNPARRVNLLNLTNGVLDELGQTPLPTGKYTQLRMVLAENTTAQPLANSVVLTGGSEVALKTPSGQQSGVKTNINIDIAANQMADFVIDFDACKSVVVAGNSGQILLKPVVTVIPRYISGVVGFVDATMLSASTSVSVQQGGVIVKASVPDSTGRFMLQPVAPGSYTLVLTASGRTTMVVTNVVVTTDFVTSVNVTGTRFNPPLSTSGTANGVAPVNTLVRVLQPLSAGPTVEVAGRFVDGITGAYSFPLVVAAPLVAPFVALPGVLVFTADGAAAGRYTLRASLSGFADKSVVLVTLVAGTTITTPITFP